MVPIKLRQFSSVETDGKLRSELSKLPMTRDDSGIKFRRNDAQVIHDLANENRKLLKKRKERVRKIEEEHKNE